MRRLILTPLLLVVLVACSETRLPAAEQASFDPVAFFTGQTVGEGVLRVVLSKAVPIAVESRGTPQADGLMLRQTIRQGDKPARMREWTIRKLGPGRYGGTLTDARGPVNMTVRGPRATISYVMKNGMEVRQLLALQADERTVLNHLEVRKFGVRVAQLDETIRKVDR